MIKKSIEDWKKLEIFIQRKKKKRKELQNPQKELKRKEKIVEKRTKTWKKYSKTTISSSFIRRRK